MRDGEKGRRRGRGGGDERERRIVRSIDRGSCGIATPSRWILVDACKFNSMAKSGGLNKKALLQRTRALNSRAEEERRRRELELKTQIDSLQDSLDAQAKILLKLRGEKGSKTYIAAKRKVEDLQRKMEELERKLNEPNDFDSLNEQLNQTKSQV